MYWYENQYHLVVLQNPLPGWNSNQAWSSILKHTGYLYACVHLFVLCYGTEVTYTIVLQEEMMRGKPGYEHLNEPLHILVEAELPVEIIDARLMQAREILEDLLKPVVCRHHLISFLNSLKQFSFSPSWRTNVNSSCLFLCRMNPRTSSRSSSCGSLRCSMAPSAKKECRGPVRLPLSTTVLEWREPRRGGKGAKIMKG